MTTPPCHAREAESLTALLDGALPEQDRAAVRAHADRCPTCGARLRTLEAGLAALRALPPAPPPSPFFATRLEARLREQEVRGAGPFARLLAFRWKLAVPATALAAAALVTVVAVRQARGREEALARDLDLLVDYEVVASVGDVETAEDAAVVADLDRLAPAARGATP